jgi:phenylacetate-CoA ligase
VSMPGCIAHRRIPALLALSDVSVVPVSVLDDEFWCSPMKIFEALAAGVPVVASAAGVVPQLLRDGELGRLTPTGDVGAMANAILDVLDNPATARRLADAGRRAAREFTWEKYVARLGEVYDSVHRGGAHRRQP